MISAFHYVREYSLYEWWIHSIAASKTNISIRIDCAEKTAEKKQFYDKFKFHCVLQFNLRTHRHIHLFMQKFVVFFFFLRVSPSITFYVVLLHLGGGSCKRKLLNAGMSNTIFGYSAELCALAIKN